MSTWTGTFSDLTRYNLQRCLAEPLFVLVGGNVNYHGELQVPVLANNLEESPREIVFAILSYRIGSLPQTFALFEVHTAALLSRELKMCIVASIYEKLTYKIVQVIIKY
ncbi:hypothetical protein ALC53_07399 [Atta colombica]|uniref:Uncharacterized protein n=1 Tax=Atta colombica TaxID=520822 RepID=A0A195BC59_9HYME|nr:hypothetical protein ALC53_07399 [Atta colombica]